MNLFDRFFRGKVEKIEDKITSVKSKSESAIQNLLSLPPLSQIRTMNISATVTRETQDDNSVVVRIVFKDSDTGHEAMNMAMAKEDARSFANSILEVIDYKEPEVVEKGEKKEEVNPVTNFDSFREDKKLALSRLTLTKWYQNNNNSPEDSSTPTFKYLVRQPWGKWYAFSERPKYNESGTKWVIGNEEDHCEYIKAEMSCGLRIHFPKIEFQDSLIEIPTKGNTGVLQ